MLDASTRRATRVFAQAALALPLVALVLVLVAQRSAWTRALAEHRPLDAAITYGQVHCGTEPSACLHRAGEDVHDVCDRVSPLVPTVHAGDLVGRGIEPSDIVWDGDVRVINDVDNLHVTQVYADGLGRNHVKAAATFGLTGDGLVEGLCVLTRTDGGVP